MGQLEATEVWAITVDLGDGSSCIYYFVDNESAESYMQENDVACCDYPEMIQTYVGSNVHMEALEGYDE